jgi:hypothetical protein
VVVVLDDNHLIGYERTVKDILSNITHPDDSFMGRLVIPLNTLQHNRTYSHTFPLTLQQVRVRTFSDRASPSVCVRLSAVMSVVH